MDRLCQDIVREHLLPLLGVRDGLSLVGTCRTCAGWYPLISTEIVARLSSLLTFPISGLIEQISQDGVIAGGSMVWALNSDFVTPESVSDIDIFLPTKSAFLDAYQLIKSTGQVTSTRTTHPKAYNMHAVATEQISILTLGLRRNISLQLIMCEFATPFDVLRSFDLDYVQCGFYRGQVYRTTSCIEAHRARRVIRGYHVPRANRLEKARRKGFSAPVIGKWLDTPSYMVPDSFTEILASFSRKPGIGQYTFDSIRLARLQVKKDGLKARPVVIYYSIGGIEYKTPSISIEIDIEAIENFVETVSYLNIVRIRPIQIGSWIITRANNGYSYLLGTGKKVVNVSFQWTGKLRMTIIGLPSNSSGVQLADEVVVEN